MAQARKFYAAWALLAVFVPLHLQFTEDLGNFLSIPFPLAAALNSLSGIKRKRSETAVSRRFRKWNGQNLTAICLTDINVPQWTQVSVRV